MPYLNVQSQRRIYFEDYQGEQLAMVLIHGWGASCRVWDTVLPALWEAGHRVVTFDQRGCGHSDKDFRSASIADAVGDLINLLDTLDVRRVVLNGWSLGGAVAVAAASQLGERCAGLILTAGASPRFTQEANFPHGAPSGAVAGMVGALRADRASFLKALAADVCVQPVGDAVRDWLWQIFMCNAPVADEALSDLETLDQHGVLESLEVPVLSIVGGEDGIVDPEVGRLATRCARQGYLVEFEGSGHAPFLEENERYRETILEFAETL